MNEPKYIKEARSFIGLQEIKGKKHSPTILGWLSNLNAWWSDDETPWCGVFVAHCLNKYNYKIPKLYMRAKAWLDWGVEIPEPKHGCLVIFNRSGGGHVGFVVGKDYTGRLLVLGGNQGNKVSIAPFDTDRVVGYRMPEGFLLPMVNLEVISSNQITSMNEA
tara:strand:- start:5162 stop:5647 length:486 start_codon:yes stop_codon:yes gene_type:complete